MKGLAQRLTLSDKISLKSMIDQMIVKANSTLPVIAMIDQLKDLLSQTWQRQSQEAIIAAINELEYLTAAGQEITWDMLTHVEETISERLDDTFANLIKKPLIEFNKASYLAGMTAGLSGNTSIMWNLPDLQALKVLDSDAKFWIGSFYEDNLQEAFRATLQDFFHGGLTQKDVANLLRVQTKDLIQKGDEYWDLLADHLISKNQEIGRVSGYEKADIEYVQFRAHLDDRTTVMCRAMHNRIIPVRYLRNQVDGYLEACKTKDKEKIKAAWPWISNKQAQKVIWQPVKDLAAAKVPLLPPLHGRCRSITVAYFEDEAEFIDEFDRGYTVSEQTLSKIDRKHSRKYKSPKKLVNTTIESIRQEGLYRNDKSKRVLLGTNDCVMITNVNGDIETIYPPDIGGKKYFDKHTSKIIHDSINDKVYKKVKKWLKSIIWK